MRELLGMNNNIQAFLNPKSVAVIGASDNPNKVGGRPIHYMKKFGYQGEIYPINQARNEIQGLQAYPDLKSINAVPDTVIFAIGGDQILDSVTQCAELGVKAGVVMSSGFSELGEEGRMKEKELVQAAVRTARSVEVGLGQVRFDRFRVLGNFHKTSCVL